MHAIRLRLLRWITRHAIYNGNQFPGLEWMFMVIYEECKVQFYEDNKPTLDAFVMERLETVLKEPWR